MKIEIPRILFIILKHERKTENKIDINLLNRKILSYIKLLIFK